MNYETNTTVEMIVETTSIDINLVIGFMYTFIIPVICALGICTNIVNIIVFSDKEMSDVTYKYLKVNACMNIIYLSICFFLFMARCGSYCEIDSSLVSIIYLYVFYTYIKGNTNNFSQ